ncbi:MAG TPA: hypothetical protein VK831_04430 [Candidatus Deferrimicrobiaceae bacterium]|nr:hypothetical protein [Candidatus Deferrimicrobiaceae bacterium]
MSQTPLARQDGRGLRFGPIVLTPFNVLVASLFVVSPGLMVYAIGTVKDEGQVTLLELGSVGLVIAFTLVALACLRGMWRAAALAQSGRAMALAIVGGLAGIGAIGSLAVTLILALVWGG